ncbi:MAG: hypothetical protein C0404_00700 [Verrucomicrobia bacterium]|nr:hypothetical protein [Verrucomicrobiota bacterium]
MPPLPLHRHPRNRIEFIYVAKGCQTYQVGTQRCDLQAGDVIVIRPGEQHSSAGFPEEPGIFYWIAIRVPEDDRNVLGLPEEDARVVSQELRAIRSRHFKGSPRIKEYLDATFLDLLAPPKDAMRMVRIRGTVLQLVAELIACAARHELPGSHPWNRKLATLIDQHLREPLDVAGLARKEKMSPQLFTMRFKELFHMVPSEYIMRRKIEQAKTTLIADPDQTITRIGMDLGFASSSHFATTFTHYTGLSPREYRKLTRNQSLSMSHEQVRVPV